MLSGSHIKIGDTARFPLGRLGSEDVYRHRWEVSAFVRDGVIVRRLHDGITRTLAVHWLDQYLTDDCYRPKRSSDEQTHQAGLERIRANRRKSAQLQTDPTKPGFYVSVRHGAKHALLLGPFVSHYDALQLVQAGRHHAREYDQYGEYAYGTCQTATSCTRGKFNAEVLES